MVVLACCAPGVAAGEGPPDARLQEAQTASDEANTSWDAGRYAEAIARGERALALREAVLGSAHPEVASSLDMLGHHLLLQGNPVRAEPLLQRALVIQEAALGKDHPEVAQSLTLLANLYSDQQLYERAEPLLQRALAIREAAFGKNHLLVAASLNSLAKLYLHQLAYARAEPLFLRALAIREAALGQNHLEVAQTLNDLGDSYLSLGLYARAEPLYVRALAIRESFLGQKHPDVAYSLWLLADLYSSQGVVARAGPLSLRAMAVREAVLENNPPNVADALRQLADIYVRLGWFARAEPLYVRALAIQEATVGKGHPLVAELLYRWAVAYQLQGLYGRAEPLYVRALAIWEAALGKSHPIVANQVVSLGNIYMAQGLYARAEPLLERALAIREAALGEMHFRVALSLGSLGSLYLAQGLYARAEPLLKRALAVLEASNGKHYPYVARPLSNLGNLYLAQGLYARAEPLLKRALAISEAAYGKDDFDVADALHDLANLYLAQGLYGKARPLYERELAIRGATSGENHPRSAEVLNHLAVVHLAQHRLSEALPLLTHAFAMSERRLRREALGFSEMHLSRFLQFLRTDEERLYALLRAHPDDARVRRLALGAALLLKGRSVEETADISRTIYRSLGAQDRETFERLGGLRSQLAQLSLQGPGSLSLPAYQQRLQELSEQGAALEADLASRSAPLRALTALPSPSEIVDRVAAALPRDGALVEFITYVDRPLVPRPGAPGSTRPKSLRYLALVLFPDSTTRTLDLGPAESIDSAASRLRDALANRDTAFEAPAQALYQLAFQPLLPLLGETRRLFLSPDGQLALVPFAALHDGHQFLVEAFDFTYLSSGKDLLPRPQESVSPGSVVVLANPDFNASLPAPTHSKGDAPTGAERSASIGHFFSTLPADEARRAWALTPLPGTLHEAESIQRLIPQAQLFLGPEATKERLMHLPTPGILHLATHGFFLGNAPESTTASRAVIHFGALGEDPQAPSPADPLLRSGLVLAGASASVPSGFSPAPPPDSTLVTALELAGLDLWGTQLVVLSACDTGRGDIKLGQGVYGLRRAFLVAGAETVVMSLWKVEDQTTSTLMEAYYRNLLAGQGRAAALREAMRELRRTQSHPHAWAPFIAMGRDAPLRSLTSNSHEAQPSRTEG
ncbi:CHAT domain-containing protein [Corallococcus llansteffanensis]|uniref:CHAT domain-containing protein n=2 Tax=Corallococcus llansteffanensis TaxID=2316731 RepID=A0A3A8QDU5_9BACT|nr:CHAT domain-containing protein [Corallococcus llansteffanensis]